MVQTIDLKEIQKHASNVYEAIIVIARRARQINDEQRLIYERESEFEEAGDFEEDELESVNQEDIIASLPKPTMLALEEFLQGELDYEYVEESVV